MNHLTEQSPIHLPVETQPAVKKVKHAVSCIGFIQVYIVQESNTFFGVVSIDNKLSFGEFLINYENNVNF